MSEDDQLPESLPSPPSPDNDDLDGPPIPRAYPIVAWAVIGMVVASLFGIRALAARLEEKQQQNEAANEDESGDLDAVTKLSFELPAKYIIGAHQLMRQMGPMAGMQQQQLYEQAEELNRGPYPLRLRFAVLAGELSGPEAALEKLAELDEAIERRKQEDKPVELTAADRRSYGLLKQLYEGYQADEKPPAGLTQQQSDQLVQHLGWFGKLALVPPGLASAAERDPVLAPAIRTMAIIVFGVMLFLFLFSAGCLIWFGLIVTRKRGQLHSALEHASPYAGIYVETFALWMVLFVLLSLIAGMLPLERFRMLVTGLAMLSSLVALVWPVFRGVPWSTVRQDLGWWSGPRSWLNPVYALVSYCAAMPLLALGLLFVLIALQLQGPPAPDEFTSTKMPSHPIVGQADGGWLTAIQMLLVAAVVAPIVEETVFRGLLYRYFRDSTRLWGSASSVVGSMLFTSFLFAVIHPQGLLAVPALMALACGFALARELRGSLVPSMLAHGIHNGSICVLLFLVL